ncbi:hypothetical protein Rsub_03232 [Raphidocelis subcapitata]|uniref:MYND-type domain-containing protein n=1 Tax=Raphidocelis subcapitata TaxID=307507 RepID=A0A2V0NYJ4_9CHLO|nr:hypothetical protein Rsub_03232 [Raphidocelis subcapitata]|eukprot:GBF90660.1 hypothetical protein Rsub_03232 [Raphidocelis subcapitata]
MAGADSRKHREVVAAAASLKASVRGLAAALASPCGTSRAAAAAPQAAAAAAALRARLSGPGGGDGDAQLPMRLAPDTGRRLAEIDLGGSVVALLAAAHPGAARWAPPAGAADAGEGEAVAAPVAPLDHPLWPQVQAAVAAACECLALLGALALRAAAAAADQGDEPPGLLCQLTGRPFMDAAARHLEALRAEAARPGAGPAAARAAAAAAAALAAPYAALTTALGGAGGEAAAAADTLCAQLAGGFRGSGLFAAACGALLAAAGDQAAGDEAHARACEAAGTALLSLSLFLACADRGEGDDEGEAWEVGPPAGDGLERDPASPSSLAARCSDSPLGFGGRTPARRAGAVDAKADADAETEAGAEADAAALAVLAAPEGLAFLEERLRHGVVELHSPSAAAALGGAAAATAGLLPGRASSGPEGASGAALCVLHCWRALLRGGPGEARAALADARGRALPLLAAALSAAAARAGCRPSCSDSPPELLNTHVMVSAAEGLSAIAAAGAAAALSPLGRAAADAAAGLRDAMPALGAAAAGAAAAAAGAWDQHRRSSLRSNCADLPHSGQLKCSDRGAAEMLRSYCGAAAASAAAVRAALEAVTGPSLQLALYGPTAASPSPAASAVGPGLFPALESLFRCVPPAAPVHAAAAELLAALLPPYASELWRQGDTDDKGRAEVASLLTTLRKFAARCAGCGLSVPEREAAAAVAATMLGVLSTLLAEAQSGRGGGSADGGEGCLATVAAAQLLPGAQVLVLSLQKAPAGPALSSMLLAVLAQASCLHRAAPQLGLLPIALAHGALPAAAAALTAAAGGGAGGRGAAAAAELALVFAEEVAAAAAPAGCCGAAEAVAAAVPGGATAVLAALLQSRLLPGIHTALSAPRGGREGGRDDDARIDGGGGSAWHSVPLPVLGALSRSSSSCSSSSAFFASGPSALRWKISSSATSLCNLGGSVSSSITAGALRIALSSPADSPPFLSAAASPPGSVPCRRGIGAGFGAGAGAAAPAEPCSPSASSAVACGDEDAAAWAGASGAAPAVQARLDALLLRLGGAALSACGAPPIGGGPQPQPAQPQPYQPRASGSDDALAQLRAAVAAARAACGAWGPAGGGPPAETSLCTPPRAPPPPLLLARSSSGGSAPSSPPSPSCGQAAAAARDASDACASASACGSGPASPRASAAEGAGAGPAFPEPLPAGLSAKLLRALSSSAPAVARSAARAAAAAGGVAGMAGAGGAPLDPESLPRLLPALAAWRVGCWSARCGSLTGASEAAAALKPCAGGCGVARFCSRACAAAAHAAHRGECQAVAAAAPEAPAASRGGLGRARRSTGHY